MIDLHMHSSYSTDGELDPVELVELCGRQGVQLLSVTDHNSVRGNVQARAAAERKGLSYVSGIEIDCVLEGAGFHLLGYGIDEWDGGFARIEENIWQQSREASRTMLQKTQALGFSITEEELWALSKDSNWPEFWTGEMFAEVLLGRPEYLEHPMLQPYRAGGARSDNPYVNFYWDFYAQGKPCYVEVRYPGMEEAVDLIHQTHGRAVLAHPGMNLKGREELLEGIIGLGIDGIEAFSSYHSPRQAFGFFNEAREHGLFATCGSDFHGKTKPAVHLGGHGCLLSEEEMYRQVGRML